MSNRAGKIWPFLAGYFLSVNLYLLPGLANSPRATDLGGALLGLWVLAKLVRGRQPLSHLGSVAVISIVPIIWLFFSLLNGQPQTAILTCRWLLAGPWALALLLIPAEEDRQYGFARGLLVGGLVNTLVIVLQQLGMQSLLQMIGLSSSGANYTEYVSHQLRIPGLHGQHNASSAVTSLMIPAGFFLYFRRRLHAALLLACILALLVALNLTSTRSPLVVTVVTIAFASLRARRYRLSIALGIFLLGIIGPLVLVYGPPGGWSRWKDTQALTSNATEREDSNLGALALILDHPLGMGEVRGHELLTEKTGLPSTHDAFLQAGLIWGLPFGLLLASGMMMIIIRGSGKGPGVYFLPGLLAFHMAGLFLFEEHLNNPTFIILTTWLVALALQQGFTSGRSPADGQPHNPR